MDLSRFFPPSILDQSFGLCISPEDLIYPSYNFHRTNYYRPWKWYMQQAEKDFGSTIQDEKEKFKIALDVQHFLPEEINVKVSVNQIIIEGKHEERQDNHGFISRQFKRRYFLPQDCDPDTVFSSLSSDGVLTVTAQKIKELKNKEIVVPIQMCETCPNKDIKNKIEKNEQVEKTNKTDYETSKKGMEIMLKEDHCCLLKPELLGAPSGVENTQTKKRDDMIKATVSDMKTSEKLDVSGPSRASTTKNMTSGLTSTGNSEITACELSTVGKVEVASVMSSTGKTDQSACGVKCAETTEKASGVSTAAKTETMASELTKMGITEKLAGSMTSGKLTETVGSAMTSAQSTETLASAKASAEMSETVVSGTSSAEKTINADALLYGLSSAGKTEKGESILCLSSVAKSEETEAVACGITSEMLTENTSQKAETSTSAISEMCNIKSMLNETIQISESSTSYSSSMASSIKETTEKISEIMNDISAQLKEAAENI